MNAYLLQHNLKGFNPKAPPKKTEAFLDIVEAGLPYENAEFAEALNILERPKAVTRDMIAAATPSHSFAQWLDDRKNLRQIPHRFESCGYTAVRNLRTGHNRWRYRVTKADGSSTQFEPAIYAQFDLSERDRNAAAEALVQQLQRDGST